MFRPRCAAGGRGMPAGSQVIKGIGTSWVVRANGPLLDRWNQHRSGLLTGERFCIPALPRAPCCAWGVRMEVVVDPGTGSRPRSQGPCPAPFSGVSGSPAAGCASAANSDKE